MTAACEILNADCIAAMAQMPADCVHLTVTSIPFEELFTYSGKPEDVGNNGSTVNIREGRFALNMRFVIAQLLRVTKPGCNCCIHIQQLLSHKVQHGFTGRRDFRGAMIDAFGAGGWKYTGEAAIVKDPQALAQRLNLHSLQFKTGHSRSSTNWAPAPNDFVLIFQKPGEPEVPVRPLVYHPSKKPTKREAFFADLGRVDDRAYVEYLRGWAVKHGAKNPGGWLSADDWICWARGVWEINEFDILDGARSGKDSGDEKHVCPLQLEIIRRCILMYSNPGDTVLDPFAGIGSTGWVALGAPSPLTKLCVDEPRSFVGYELKESYHRLALKNAAKARRLVARQAKEGVLFA